MSAQDDDLQGLIGVAQYTPITIDSLQTEQYISEVPEWVDMTGLDEPCHKIQTYDPTNKQFIQGISQFIDSNGQLQVLYTEIETESFDIVYICPTTNNYQIFERFE
jgi:hypothetical protein